MRQRSIAVRRLAGCAAALAGGLLLVPAVAAAHTPTRPPKTEKAAPTRATDRVVYHFPKQSLSQREPIIVRFLHPVTASQATLTTGVPGRWTQHGARTLRFVPTRQWAPYSTVHVTIGSTKRLEVIGATSFSVLAKATPGELVQALATLHFLPVHTTAKGQTMVNPGWPTQLSTLWTSDRAEVLHGAIVAFESQHGLDMDGAVSATLWQSLDQALAAKTGNSAGYTYALASQSSPESLTIWHDAHEVMHVAANTGIADSPTEPGTFSVYERLQSQIMRGTNPGGSSYADPVSWVAYFNGGDAVHYIARASYGYPQSLGCVELSYGDAEQAWPYLSYGTLVTVTPE